LIKKTCEQLYELALRERRHILTIMGKGDNSLNIAEGSKQPLVRKCFAGGS
jgi:hypothetical protein